MPNFDRSTLAKFLPDPRAIAAFEALNKAVDVTLPGDIDSANGVATQALIAAQQALAQLVDVASRLGGLELAPTAFQEAAPDNLTPPSIAAAPGDDLAPAATGPSQSDDLSPAASASSEAGDFAPHYI